MSMMIDTGKPREEQIRWIILVTLNNAAPGPAAAPLLLRVVRGTGWTDATPMEVHREARYLETRGLLRMETDQDGLWLATPTRYGTDVAMFTVPCAPGIARPEFKWW